MKKLLNSINTRIKYILNNSNNDYITKECNIINIKLDDIRNRMIKTEELLNEVCDKIIDNDIYKLKRVPDQPNMVYKKMNELENFIKQIKELYFKSDNEINKTQ